MNWDTPIRFLSQVGPIVAGKLKKLGIETVGDLLWHLPFRYEDYSLISKIGTLQAGEKVTVIADVREIKNVYTRRGLAMQKALAVDETGELEIIWFNQSFLVKTLKNARRVAFVGQVDTAGYKLTLVSPEYEIAVNKELIHTGRMVPVYPETKSITSRWFRNRIFSTLTADWLTEYLPQHILHRYDFPSLPQAFMQVHFPKNREEADMARRRFAFEELFFLQLLTLIRRRDWQSKKVSRPMAVNGERMAQFTACLPFSLTRAQSRAMAQIMGDLEKPAPMNRLLQGDVGSGKTVVAAAVLYIAFLNNAKSLFMAPTEILAEQHYATLAKLLSPFEIKVGIQTRSHKTNSSRFDVIVGTHALLEKKVQLDRVGLVVIDEQHRFGVRQRALLRDKGKAPHVLTMTATPIPRTQVLTMYGDLDLSTIDEMPVGRKPVKTWVVPPEKRIAAYAWIRKQILNSALQTLAFIVCPFIEPSETLTSVKAVNEEFKYLEKNVFTDLKLGLLHGRMKTQEKNQILEHFRKGVFSILVATPVVEVGIDIPGATIIVIETAERFGLAQLHQLRGRVGRSDVQSFCLLFQSEVNPAVSTRLKHLETNATGATLAEIDLKIRGGGQIYGTIQHGRQELRVANPGDTQLLDIARREAKNLLVSDPELRNTPALNQRLKSDTIPGQVAPD